VRVTGWVARLVAALVGLGLSVGASPPQAAAFTVQATASATAATYSICSWVDRRSCEHTIATVASSVQPGTLYQVGTSATFRSLSVRAIYTMAQLACFDGVSGAFLAGDSLAQYRNVVPADSAARLAPRLIVRGPASGRLACALLVRGTRDHPSSPAERYGVVAGWVQILGGLRAGSANRRLVTADPTGVTVKVGRSYDIVLGPAALDPRWRALDTYGELYATTQAPPGASTTLTTQLILVQYPYGSGGTTTYCQRASSGVRTSTVSHLLHHVTLYSALTAYARAGCLPSVKVILRVRVTRGYPLTISGNGTTLVTAAVR
jgi:hypothetical protein